METSEPVDLNFLARQLQRLTTDVASLRDDVQVLTSIVLRQDGTLNALLQETRATHTQIQRMNERIRKLEAAQP
jgi:peptidoglycan hydrolase CwlO-like protein